MFKPVSTYINANRAKLAKFMGPDCAATGLKIRWVWDIRTMIKNIPETTRLRGCKHKIVERPFYKLWELTPDSWLDSTAILRTQIWDNIRGVSVAAENSCYRYNTEVLCESK